MLEEASSSVRGAGNSDPFLARTIRVTNTLDEVLTFRFESALEIVPLDPLSAVGEGRFSAEVFDTGGDPGAELTFDLGHTLREENSQFELDASVSHSGTINEEEISTLEVGPTFVFGFTEQLDRILSSAFLTLSPGDTAEVTAVGNFGYASTSLTALTDIHTRLAAINAFADDLVGIPEPSSLVLLCIAVSMLTNRQSR